MRKLLIILLNILWMLFATSCKKNDTVVNNQNKELGPGQRPPAAPQQLKATAVSEIEIDLAWKDTSGYITGFKIERYDPVVGWVILDSTFGYTTSYQDNNVRCNTGYYYRVAAYNPVGFSPFSNLATATALADDILLQPAASINNLNSVFFTTHDHGFAAGDKGTILRTTDGGISWDTVSSGTLKNLRGISFSGLSSGMAVGDGGTVLQTTDGGGTWHPLSLATPPPTIPMWAVSSASPSVWVIVGGSSSTIFRTTDGGGHWTKPVSGTLSVLRAVSFLNLNLGTIVGASGTILSTSNGGASWGRQAIGLTSTSLYGVAFSDSVSETVVGANGLILRTTDLGSTWFVQPSNTSSTLYSVFYVDRLVGIAVGSNGAILQTTTGGKLWANQLGSVMNSLSGVYYNSSTNATAVGAAGTVASIATCTGP